MPICTPFHQRTFPLCESLNYREWSGYYAVSAYETHHEHEYNAIRNAAALIDISPLFKYRVTGPDATRLVDRIITRDMRKVSVGQVVYTPWCDEQGKVIDDGTVSRLEENVYRWTAADPSLRWFTQNGAGLDVQIEDISESVAALALQGPTSGRLLKTVVEDADIGNLKYFRVTRGRIAGVPVEISRTGYTGDLGYEIWVANDQALRVWDVLIDRGRPFEIKPAGMLALDVARIEAGLLLIDVDFNSSKKALLDEQKYSPFEMGLDRLVNLDKDRFIGQQALIKEGRHGAARQIVGLEIDWTDVERRFEAVGLPPTVSPIASRVAVPVYSKGTQIGKATSTTWSPLLKNMIALATLKRDFVRPGTQVEIEITVEAVRHRVGAKVAKTPFYNPRHKTATPI
ncbi:MAG TPA: aminomethyltransferase family protein [Pyrinomonadaceae bacterium]|nr:aminomethyltransferase family protein [Pyrinomonadaceae bacterium]